MFERTDRHKSLRTDLVETFVSNLMTDDERAKLYGLPEGCRMRENAKIYSPDKLQCGKHVWIGEDAKLDASGGLMIGDHTSIGLGVFIWSHTSMLANALMSNGPGSPLIRRSPTRIGSGCFIGGPSVVYPGVSLGDCTIVLPMSVVRHDVAGYEIIGGSPAKRIKSLTPATIEALIDDLPLDPEQKQQYLADFDERYRSFQATQHPAER